MLVPKGRMAWKLELAKDKAKCNKREKLIVSRESVVFNPILYDWEPSGDDYREDA